MLQPISAVLCAVLLTSAFGQEPPQRQQQQQHWMVEHTKDEMTDKSITMVATASDNHPDVALGIGCASGKAYVAISGPNLHPARNDRVDCSLCAFSRWYMHYQTNVRLRFDSEKETGTKLWVQGDAHSLVAWAHPADKDLVKKLMGAQHFLVQYEMLGGGSEVLSFPVSGLREALQQAPECGMEVGSSTISAQSVPRATADNQASSATEPPQMVSPLAPVQSSEPPAAAQAATTAPSTATTRSTQSLSITTTQPASTVHPTALPVTVEQATVVLWSDPTGASIEIDGKHVGTTPTTLVLQPGVHNVTMQKQDFATWEKAVTFTTGQNRVSAYMQQVGLTLH